MQNAVNYSDDLEYARRRLQETLVRLGDGTPIRVMVINNTGGKFVCCYENLVTQSPSTCLIEELDLTPVPLGFFSYGERASAFCVRKPTRKPVQGLSSCNIHIYNHHDFTMNFSWRYLLQPIFNTYPKVEDAIKELKNSSCTGSTAFAREFAVDRRSPNTPLYLMYRTHQVGVVEDGNLKLDDDKMFLSEHLEECL